MIRNTFQLIPGVGPWRERDFWARGILTWDDFPLGAAAVGISRRMDAVARVRIEESREALANRDLKGVDGWDAVILWRIFRSDSDLEALRFLVEYNLYDSLQLKTLVEKLYNRGVDLLGCEAPRVSVFDRGEVLYDLSKLLLGLGPPEREPRLRAQLRSERRVLP